MTLNLCILYLASLIGPRLLQESSTLGGLQDQIQIFSGKKDTQHGFSGFPQIKMKIVELINKITKHIREHGTIRVRETN